MPGVRRFFVMRVGGEHSFVEFSSEESVPEHLPGGADIACSVEASCGGFGGRVGGVWFSRGDVNRFLSELRSLEETRRGSANLLNMSSRSEFDPLRFELYSVGGSGTRPSGPTCLRLFTSAVSCAR